ncbi:hypothetical protein PRIPAC_95897 [Pristionchus pacificus]|uniref:Uncharacterized protein n=1 Tax=Pristionchus pacificus TaxID=54126 RepID=A0A2A6BD20_PRIPA|nr:hypothetical protein PRIPAC_95897 [Pristionchus pacificus]|eukprot:PDM63782.1 hypothetical protein PRIPAC_49755 [Pristionchus pacificus]
MKKKERKEEKQQEKWKAINWMDRKRQDHQTLPKYVRPALYLQYTKVLEEIDQMKKGIHPKDLDKELKAMEEECKERAEESRRRQERKYNEKKGVLDKKHGTGTSQQSRVLKEKRDELYAWMMEDVEERLRSIDTDSNEAEPFWIEGLSGKKFLRSGRPAVASTPIDYVPGSDMDLNKKRKPNMQPLSYLISESGIYRDLRRLGMLDALHSRSVSIYKAQIDNQKLTYEGRAYPRGQPLFIQTSAFAWFPVMILSMSEGWIQFRSSIPGDTRCVTATIEDLEAGRVLVSKFPRDANAPPPLPVSQFPPVITLQ